MNNKHTKGDWMVERCHLGQWVMAGESYIVAIPDHLEHDGAPCGSIVSQDKTQEELNANAALISAAPDLLDACLALLDMATDSRCHGSEIDFACAAIAKAKGETRP